MPVERPPILQGSAEQQLAALRDYLFRLAGSLETVQSAPVFTAGAMSQAGTGGISGSGSGTSAATEEKIRQNARELRALIIKTANTITAEMDSREESYYGDFVARSDIGTFEQEWKMEAETTARSVVESFQQTSVVNVSSDQLEEFQKYVEQINGEIRRGFLDDPDHPGETIFGIAISSHLQFTSEVQTHKGYEYYELTSGQTFGFYTSTGWQFWIDGRKAGWFDITDGFLHVANIYVENQVYFGDTWRMRQTRGGAEIEIIYVGVEAE